MKVRGYRIEVGEVEAVMREHGSVEQSVVIAREGADGVPRLVAYIVADENSPSDSELRAYMRTKLPEYMVPTILVRMEALPLTPNGKIDVQRLPSPDVTHRNVADSFVAPRTEIEEMVAGIWNEVLRVKGIGVEDNFFDLGGNSLLGTQMVASSWYQVLFFALIGLLLFVLPHFQQVNATLLTGFVLAIFFMRIPFEDLTGLIPNLARASIALKRIESLGLSLKSDTNEEEAPNLASPDPSWKSLELVHVTHTYYRESHNASFTLGPLDLTLRPGELTFLIGGNGSGKTSLAKLITGLYTPEEGEIRLDGQPITDHNRDLYRQHFAVVFSDFFLIFVANLGRVGLILSYGIKTVTQHPPRSHAATLSSSGM